MFILGSLAWCQTGWTVTYTYSGQTIQNGQTSEWPNRIDGAPITQGGYAEAGQGYSGLSVSTGGTVTIKLTWSGQGAAPTYLWVLLTGSADWEVTWNQQGPAGSADDGLTDSYAPDPDGLSGLSAGSHLKRLNVSHGVAQVTYSLSASCSSAHGSEAQAFVSLTAAPTTKGLSLHRQDGGSETVDGDSYGADTLLSWSGTDDLGNNYTAPGTTAETVLGALLGSWSQVTLQYQGADGQMHSWTGPNVKWDWSGSASAGSKSYSPPLLSAYNLYTGNAPLENGNTNTQTETWKLTATDLGDATSADCSYKWTFHHVYENWNGTRVGQTTSKAQELVRAFDLTQSNPSAEFLNVQYDPRDQEAFTIFQADLLNTDVAVLPWYFSSQALRAAVGRTATAHWDAFYQPDLIVHWSPVDAQGIGGDGDYVLWRYYTLDLYQGTVDVYGRTGALGTSHVTEFCPVSSIACGVRVFEPGE